jgi:hypothetical protein
MQDGLNHSKSVTIAPGPQDVGGGLKKEGYIDICILITILLGGCYRIVRSKEGLVERQA